MKVVLQIFLARFLQDLSYLARKASFLVQDSQDLVQALANLARKILARFGYFLQDAFYWGIPSCRQLCNAKPLAVCVHAQP